MTERIMASLARAVDGLRQDVTYALRSLRREPAINAAIAAILALGIGVNVAVFSVASALLLRPLPFPDSDRLLWVSNTYTSGLSGLTYSVGVYDELQRRTQSVEMSAYYAFFGFFAQTLTGQGDPERIYGVPVAPRFFEVLRVTPAHGRLFTADEHRTGGPPAVVLGHSIWERRFAANPAIVGQAITLNGAPMTVVGVMRREFDFASVFVPGARVEIFLPARLEEMRQWGNTLAVVGRLHDGATPEAAQAEFATVRQSLSAERKDLASFGVNVTTLTSHVRGNTGSALLVLWGCVGLVLVITWANVASLLLARASERSTEYAVRAALGASRTNMLRPLFAEGVLLSGVGAILSAPVAIGLTTWLTSGYTVTLPLLHYVRVDSSALVATAVIAVLTAIAVTVVPGLRVALRETQSTLLRQQKGGDVSQSVWLRQVLLVSEVALTSVLLVAAGLLIRSFISLIDVKLGFDPERVVVVHVEAVGPPTTTQGTMTQELTRRISALPGIQAVALSDALPLDRNRSWVVRAAGRTYAPDQLPTGFAYFVTPEYFRTMSIEVRAGRSFLDADAGPLNSKVARRPVILNRTLANILFPGTDPVGRDAIAGNVRATVVGVVEDVRQSSLDEAPVGQFYLPMTQIGGPVGTELLVRSSLPPSSLMPSLRKTLVEVDPRLLATEMRSLGDFVHRVVSPRRYLTSLLIGFAIFAVMVASVGVYGLTSHGVAKRSREIGLRMALGATGRDVRRQIVAGALRLVIVGIAIGGIASLALSRLVESLLFETSPADPWTFVLMALVLGLTAYVASYVPARRASRLDPCDALRAE